MKKLLSILLALMLILFVVPLGVKGISDVSVTVNPPYRLDYGEYTITLVTEADLTGGIDSIIIQFPPEANIPCTSCAYGHCPSCFKINGYNASRVGLIEGYTKTIYLTMPGGISAKKGDKIEIVISQGANFQNPSIPGKYHLNVWSTREPQVQSNNFEILSTNVENLSITNNPDTAGLISTFKITFTTGVKGNLINGQNIYIEFPEGMPFPKTLKKTSVTVNDSYVSDISLNGNVLVLKIPNSINSKRDVTIYINSSFGMTNPEKGGTYSISLWTDAEPEKVQTQLNVKAQKTVSTQSEVTPPGPDGTNGYYRTIPIITLYGETNTGEVMQTFYKIDEGKYQSYAGPFTIPDGVHILKYYSKTDTLTENEQTKNFNVDTLVPQINIEVPSKDPFYTYDSQVIISGYLSEDAQLSINSTNVALKESHSFTFVLPVTIGENTITLKVTDLAGNHALKQIKIILDETTPVLTIEAPKEWSKITTKYITIKGSIYPVNTNVYAGNQKISVNEDGTFNYQYIPETPGSLISVKITAIYQLTGKNTEKAITLIYEPHSEKILLTVDKNTALVDGIEKAMDIAPFIDKNSNRTLVPVRFVSEFLGGTVDWNASTKSVTIKFGENAKSEELEVKLTIGNTLVYVNGKEVKTDVAPLIKDNRTFVPLRFIAETMGFSVEWNSTNRSITITAP